MHIDSTRVRARSWAWIAAIAVACTAIVHPLAHAGAATAEQTQSVPRGPEGEAFYYPPERRLDGPHGSVIWARPLDGSAALPGADNWLVLYRSRTADGETVAVSGTVAIPHGQAPEGGWPVMSWTHGTTGVADICAPSRDSTTHPAHEYLELMDQTAAKWVERGYAVTKTDYLGLGTDGPHGYLIGVPEARAAADITFAAHQLSRDLSREWIVNGHSQGGQAALFAAEVGESWVPELDLRGAVALAPGSNYGLLFVAARNLPSEGAALMALVIRGVETAVELKTEEVLTTKAWSLLPQTADRCIDQLRKPDSWGGISNNEVFKDDADMSDFDRVIDKNDPAHLNPNVPVFLVHGGQDETAPHAMSDALYLEYKAKGANIEYRFYPDEDHRGVVATSFGDAAAWADARTGR